MFAIVTGFEQNPLSQVPSGSSMSSSHLDLLAEPEKCDMFPGTPRLTLPRVRDLLLPWKSMDIFPLLALFSIKREQESSSINNNNPVNTAAKVVIKLNLQVPLK